MKTLVMLLASTGLLGLVACSPNDRPRDGRRGGPPDPFFQMFDVDQDGEISATEIDAAAAVMRLRDRNEDGVLTADEMPRPPRHDHEPPRGCDGQRPDRDPSPPRPELETSDAAAGTVILRGGYETDSRDGGRPVALIAAALGVSSDVFRDAFGGVSPSRFGPPSASRAQANKKVLMDALGPHGVTNDRLDEVSNYYRYNVSAGEVWRRSAAKATAVMEDGKVVGLKLVNAGSGYTTPPIVTVAGHPHVKVKATIEFSNDFKTNGRVASLTIID